MSLSTAAQKAPPITVPSTELHQEALSSELCPQRAAARGGPQNSSACVLCCGVRRLGATSWMRSINSLFSRQALHSSPHEAKTLFSSRTRILDRASLLQSSTRCSKTYTSTSCYRDENHLMSFNNSKIIFCGPQKKIF